MTKITIGNLELDMSYAKGISLGITLTPAGMRPVMTYETVFSYDCETGLADPDPLAPSKEFEAAIWCRPPLPATLQAPPNFTEEERRKMDRQGAACERALLDKSGLNAAQFGRALSPLFPKVPARVPVADIQTLIPDFSFNLVMSVHWIHCACQTNIADFQCNANLRFPYAYDYRIFITRNCGLGDAPNIVFPRHYFELTETEKEFEREGQRQQDAMMEMFKKLGDGPNGHAEPGPEGH